MKTCIVGHACPGIDGHGACQCQFISTKAPPCPQACSGPLAEAGADVVSATHRSFQRLASQIDGRDNKAEGFVFLCFVFASRARGKKRGAGEVGRKTKHGAAQGGGPTGSQAAQS